MSTHYHALIWIDHRVARVFHFNDDESDLTTIKSSHSREHLHHKANAGDSGHAPVDKEYLDRVTQAVERAGAILIVGPGSARTELQKHLQRLHPQVARKVSAVEAIDHPSDGALLAHARRFFRADDRMRGQIHA